MKRVLFIQSRAPHGSLTGQEGLDAILMGTAFASCSVLLLEDGIFQLLKGQDTTSLGTRDYSVTYGALKDYGVETIYVSESHMRARGLSEQDLLLPIVAMDDAGVMQLMREHDVILGS